MVPSWRRGMGVRTSVLVQSGDLGPPSLFRGMARILAAFLYR